MIFARRSGLPGVDAENPIALTVTGRVSRAVVPDLCAELERALADPADPPSPRARRWTAMWAA